MLGHRTPAALSCALVFAASAGMACSSASASTPKQMPSSTTLDVPKENPDAVPDNDVADEPGGIEQHDAGVDAPAMPPIFGPDGRLNCAVKEPIKSADACNAAADCAPAALCHARACVATANAPKAPPGGVSCTMNLVCRSTDVGRCDCVDGVCALVAK